MLGVQDFENCLPLIVPITGVHVHPRICQAVTIGFNVIVGGCARKEWLDEFENVDVGYFGQSVFAGIINIHFVFTKEFFKFFFVFGYLVTVVYPHSLINIVRVHPIDASALLNHKDGIGGALVVLAFHALTDFAELLKFVFWFHLLFLLKNGQLPPTQIFATPTSIKSFSILCFSRSFMHIQRSLYAAWTDALMTSL